MSRNSSHFSRRRALRLGLTAIGVGAALPVLAACGATTPTPTPAPAVKPAAVAPTAAPAAAPAAASTQAPAAAPTVAPAAAKPVASQTYKISFANDWNSGARGETVKFALQEFQKANPNVTVEPLQMGGGAGTSSQGGLFETVVAQFIGGQAPDVIFGWPEMVPVYNRYLADLTPLWRDKNADSLGIVDHPQITHFEGKRFAVDFAPASGGWLLNTTMVEKAGLPLPKEEWTWQEQLDLALKLNNPDQKQWGMWFRHSWDLDFFPFVMSNKEDPKSYFTDKEETKVGYDTPAAFEGFQWFVDFIYKHKVAPNPAAAAAQASAETSDLFMLGLAAMTGSWFQGTGDLNRFIKDRFEWKLMPQPRAPKNPAYWHTGQTEPCACSKDGENRGNLEPSLDLMLFLAGSDVVQNFVADPVNRPTIPVKTSVLASPAYLTGPPNNMQIISKQMNDAANAVNARHPKKYWAEWMQTVTAEADRALIGEATAEEAWKGVVEKTQRIIDANR